jgi:hypothetical protein
VVRWVEENSAENPLSIRLNDRSSVFVPIFD